MMFKGIDISKWQTDIDWSKLKKSIDFVIIRATYSTTTDTLFKTHIKNAIQSNIPVGVYCYSKAKSIEDAKKEAKYLISQIKEYNISYPVVLDAESDNLLTMSYNERNNAIKEFLEIIEQAGYYAMLYSNKNWLSNYLDINLLSRFDIWLAEWKDNPTWNGNYGIWQYGLDKIEGIGCCDCNIAYKNYSKIINSMKNKNKDTIKIGDVIHYKGIIYPNLYSSKNAISVNDDFTITDILPLFNNIVKLSDKGYALLNNISE